MDIARIFLGVLTMGSYFPLTNPIFHSFPLLSKSCVPNLKDMGGNDVHMNAFPAQMISSGDWSSSTWASNPPNYRSNVYLLNNISATANGLTECAHLIIEDGAT